MGTIQRKRGPWSLEEDEIIQNGISKGMDAEHIQLLLEEEGIYRHLSTLKKRIAFLKTRDTIHKDIESSTDLRTLLHAKEFWAELQLQLTTQELGYFEAKWIQLYEQFQGDILPSEEMQLQNYIVLSILINRLLGDMKYHRGRIRHIRNDIDKECMKDERDRDYDKINVWESTLASLEASLKDYNREHTNLLTRFESIGKDLKANRDARIKNIKDAKTNWLAMLQLLDEEEVKKRIGNEAELLKMAKDVEYKRLSEWHTYDDGMLDQPILNSETVREE